MKQLMGQKVKDPVTGIEGVVTGRVEYLFGNPEVLLEFVKDGKRETLWLAEARFLGTAAVQTCCGAHTPTVAETHRALETVAAAPAETIAKAAAEIVEEKQEKQEAKAPAEEKQEAKPEPEKAPAKEEKKPKAEKKTNGKTASPEELQEEMKKLILSLAQKANRDAVVKVLSSFGVQKASEIPVVKVPEFIAALKAAGA